MISAEANKILDAAQRAKNKRTDYLRARGWNYKCDSPGSYWYWERMYGGQRWTLFTDSSAFDFQLRIENET